MKKLYIETLGCAMNVRDSEHIIAELTKRDSFQLTEEIQEADLILINTCSVREKPVHKLFSEIGYFNKVKKPGAKIGVCGCTASHLGEEIIRRAPYVSFVLGARNVSKIREVIHREGAVEVDLDHDESQYAFEEFRSSPYRAYINISIGCDKQCTFCIVPHTRGEEISIPPELIVAEAQKAARNGAKEIFLLGQNVNNYGRRFTDRDRRIDFTDLLRMVAQIDEVARIRFTSPHPLHMDDRFLEEFATNPKICKSMHMPLQSGSSRILRRMKRGYTKEWFLERAARLREMAPGVRISTDIIVGFPGEEESDFEETLDVVRQVGFEQIFSFKYSPRPLTPAKDYPDQVPEEVASRRLSQLQELHAQMLDAIAAREKGKVHQVYFEELKPGGYVAGRSDNNWIVKVPGSEELLGQFRQVKITKPGRLALEGVVVG
ncbi:MAG: tRNA (N6-isopentenyl adenosine(37)-C2)-methylthiotransferase MiaB [Nitratiruptor sp.]|nr:tRNA (N6-isopentenyl adenosine(37)-C2)-methylthiotransferase MiaB [Nitratiruptor sp.]NPA83067.1 tRNA (N6-isopentenyl adenosine(37)-C2)-methylthiotransferase MiaB [Campylobacterota bacterium]